MYHMKTPRKGSVWFFRPSSMSWDVIDKQFDLPFNTQVQVVQPYGCPKNGTMGHCYISNAKTKAFIGLVQVSSLQK